MARQHILTVGSLNMDEVIQVARLPVAGETLLEAASPRLIPGGKGANQAVAMARLGASVSMAGRVGRDPAGATLLQALAADGVDLSLVAIDDQAATGVAFIFLVPGGENAIIVAAGANMRVGRDQQQMQSLLAALPQAQALVLQLEIPLETVQALIAASHQAGVPVMLNLAPAQALPLATLRHLEALIVNATEASQLCAALSAATAPVPVPRTIEESIHLATWLHSELGIAYVALTLGEQGAVLVHQEARGQTLCIHLTPPRVQAVDTTAAGDCFAGALTVALSEGQQPAGALRFAVYASALKVTTFGAQSGLPMRQEVEALLRSPGL
ncbi:MAG TPA: ribokinase [Ktedonobacteraceae bacterium]|jgi:ribokinase